MQILGAMGCKAAIFEDGSTWIGSKRMADPKGGKGEHFGYEIKFATDPQHLPKQESVEAGA